MHAHSWRRRLLPSSRHRLQVSILVALFVVLGAAGTVALTVINAQLVDRVDRDLTTTATSLRGLVTPGQLAELAANPNRGASREAFRLLASDGRIVADLPAGSATERSPGPDLANFTTADLRARIGVPFSRPSAAGGAPHRVVVTSIGDDGDLLIASAPLTDVRDTLALLGQIILASAAAAVAVLAGLVWTFSRNAFRPIDDMIGVAGEIGAGNFGARIDPPDAAPAEVERMADALNAMLNHLETAFADKEATEDRLRRFVADASHELRTPLTTIQGWADLYQAGGRRDPAMTDRAMDRISHEAARMSGLVEDLLLLARLDQHRALVTEPVDLTALLVDSVADLRAIQPERPLVTRVPDHPLVIDGDDASLRQVVVNLLANIRVHTDPHTPARASLDRAGSTATLTISDDGPGLLPEDAAHIFDRFYRPEGSRSRATGGSGLGLAIARSVIEAHGGTIAVATEPGAGATFTIRLPLDGTADAAPTSPTEASA